MTALPAHWAAHDGITDDARRAFRARAQRVLGQPTHQTRSEQKNAAQNVISEARSAGAFAVDAGAAGIGLVKHSTSQTERLLGEALAELQGGEGFFEMSQHEARLARMARGVRSACKVHAFSASDWPAAAFTLTHEKGEAPKQKDISHFIDCLKKWALRSFNVKSLRYVWVAELQEDRARRGDFGAVHYHVCVWLPPELKRRANSKPWLRGDGAWVLPKPDKKGWWKKGSTERQWVRKSVRSYFAKYMSKGGDGTWFPKGLRLHGAGGFNKPEREVRSHDILPKWLKEQVHPHDRCVRAKGGGWVSRLTAERFASPYFVLATGRVIRIVRITECNAKTVKQYCELAVQKAMGFPSNLKPSGLAQAAA